MLKISNGFGWIYRTWIHTSFHRFRKARIYFSFSDIKDEVKQIAQELVDGWFAQNADPFGDQLIVDGPPAGLYVLYLTDASGCGDQISDPIYVSGTNSSLEITVDTSTGGIEYFNTNFLKEVI